MKKKTTGFLFCIGLVAAIMWSCRNRPSVVGSFSGLNSVAFADITKLDQDYENICGSISQRSFSSINGVELEPRKHPAAVCVAGTTSLSATENFVLYCCAKKKFSRTK